ncbi:uncharacterized protein LOC144207762 [Stigmatopora nigra]
MHNIAVQIDLRLCACVLLCVLIQQKKAWKAEKHATLSWFGFTASVRLLSSQCNRGFYSKHFYMAHTKILNMVRRGAGAYPSRGVCEKAKCRIPSSLHPSPPL